MGLEAFGVCGCDDGVRQPLGVRRHFTGVTGFVLFEDIDKFQDRNLAASLQRLPEVSIQCEDAEGTYASIRGMEPNLRLVTIDSRAASFDGPERAFDFAKVSTNLVSSPKVIKTQSADFTERLRESDAPAL
ncbi:MAG: hypothetical protein D6820_01850 [Lentisphaerae bacterium]|nr:MAG: hypothetical protein D6820_01850 [Lentisphaerota bacterium]